MILFCPYFVNNSIVFSFSVKKKRGIAGPKKRTYLIFSVIYIMMVDLVINDISYFSFYLAISYKKTSKANLLRLLE